MPTYFNAATKYVLIPTMLFHSLTISKSLTVISFNNSTVAAIAPTALSKPIKLPFMVFIAICIYPIRPAFVV